MCDFIFITLTIIIREISGLNSGKKDGAVQMVKVGTNVEAHQWSAAEQRWTKVGDVVGSSGGSSGGGRTLHEGRVKINILYAVQVSLL